MNRWMKFGISVGLMLLVRRTAPDGGYFHDGDRAAGVFGVLATGFSVLLACDAGRTESRSATGLGIAQAFLLRGAESAVAAPICQVRASNQLTHCKEESDNSLGFLFLEFNLTLLEMLIHCQQLEQI